VIAEKDREDIRERHKRVIQTLNQPGSFRQESIIGKFLEKKFSKIL
jgi:hypothetical protein